MGTGGVSDGGIIPACAGNTSCMAFFALGLRDHPRMRGEHVTICDLHWFTVGSSPHARGTLLDGSGLAHRTGIIPACAGNT